MAWVEFRVLLFLKDFDLMLVGLPSLERCTVRHFLCLSAPLAEAVEEPVKPVVCFILGQLFTQFLLKLDATIAKVDSLMQVHLPSSVPFCPLSAPILSRVRKSKNLPDSKIFTAKTFRIKCLNLDIADFATNARKPQKRLFR